MYRIFKWKKVVIKESSFDEVKKIEEARKGNINSAKFLVETTGEKADNNVNIETKSPVFNIEVTDNSKLEKKFKEYEANTKTD